MILCNITFRVFANNVVAVLGNARFTFDRIDPNDPERQFSYLVIVDEQDKYDVVDCEPALEAGYLVEILEELNRTEDMAALARSMSKCSRLLRVE